MPLAPAQCHHAQPQPAPHHGEAADWRHRPQGDAGKDPQQHRQREEPQPQPEQQPAPPGALQRHGDEGRGVEAQQHGDRGQHARLGFAQAEMRTGRGEEHGEKPGQAAQRLQRMAQRRTSARSKRKS